MKPFRAGARLIAAIVVALGVASLPMPEAEAAPQCLKSDNQCSPDKLCTFRASLAEKVLIYQTYLRNSQLTKRRGKRDGIRYDGRLYDESVQEARDGFPRESAEERAVRAGQIFQEKIRKDVADKFKYPTCQSGTYQSMYMPKVGYSGMYTTEACQVFVRYQGGEYDAAGFGANDATSCQEIYDRDRAHEIIHQRRCEAAKKNNAPQTLAIDELIEEELVAYEHSVRLTHAYVRLLSIQCSARATPDQIQARARRVQELLSPYIQK